MVWKKLVTRVDSEVTLSSNATALGSQLGDTLALLHLQGTMSRDIVGCYSGPGQGAGEVLPSSRV